MWKRIAGCVCLLGLAACGDCGAEKKQPEGVATAPSKGTKSLVTGFVRLADGYELPGYALSDMERKVLDHAQRGAWPESCTPPKDADRKPVKLTSDGALVGVMVAASGFHNATPRPPKVHEVTIEDCRLTPSLVVAVKGDSMVLRNAVDFPFMPTFGPTAVARTLTPGQKFDIDLDRGGVESVLCGFTAPCGRTDVITVYHPVYAVTGADGRFTIEDFPADQTIDLNAWHPLFEEAKISLSVGVGETKEVEITLTPKAHFLPDAGVAKEEAAAKPGAKVDGTSPQ